jgi:hypothetical protein
MPVTLPQGTKEYVVVDVADELNTLVDLAGTTPQYRVLDATDAEQLTWTAAVVTLMKARCMIDTQLPTLWDGGAYRLYLRFTTAPELPWLGPFEFDVEAP